MVDRNIQDGKNLIKNKTELNFYYPPVKAAIKCQMPKKYAVIQNKTGFYTKYFWRSFLSFSLNKIFRAP